MLILALTTLLSVCVIPAYGLECQKTGPCSCKSEEGEIDLSPLASNGSARFRDILDTSGQWLFSYNPCTPFDEVQCSQVAACQISPDVSTSYPIGSQDSAVFKTDGTGNVFLEYSSTGGDGVTRTTHVTLLCDESQESGTLAVRGDDPPGSAIYRMTLTSSHCCPKKPGPPITTPAPTVAPEQCVQSGPCSCRSSEGTIDLSPLARTDNTPAFQNKTTCDSQYVFSFNPCSAFTYKDCKNASVCMSNTRFNVQFSLGSPQSAEFLRDSATNDVLLVYKSTDFQGTSRMAIVRLICDPSGNPDSLRVLGETGPNTNVYLMTLTSVYCCPRAMTSQRGFNVRKYK